MNQIIQDPKRDRANLFTLIYISKILKKFPVLKNIVYLFKNIAYTWYILRLVSAVKKI